MQKFVRIKTASEKFSTFFVPLCWFSFIMLVFGGYFWTFDELLQRLMKDLDDIH